MTFQDDAAIERFVREAHLPPLLVALAQATGDLALLRDDLAPDPAHDRDPQGGMTADQRSAARRLAVEALKGLRDGRVGGAPVSDPEVLRRMMTFMLGEPVADEYLPLLLEELAVGAEDGRAPDWRKDTIDPGREFSVAVIGAGMSGLLAAHRLQQAGVPLVVLEKNHEVGGTWLENDYPGCRVDVPNHFYSYSFAQRDDWPQHFSPRDVLLDYFRRCADDLGLRGAIRFGTEVEAAEFHEDRGTWRLMVRAADGGSETLEANVLISAVGQLNRPRLPDIEGREAFSGPSFHSAQWDHTVDLRGKRVAVIGTGASAIQLIPAIAGDVAELDVYQRTPNWFMPTPNYHDAVPEGMRWLLTEVPSYGRWYRFWLFWRLVEGVLPAARVDPGWSGGPDAVSARSDELRAMLTQHLQAQFADRPDLLEQVVPHYPPLAKRILLDDGTWVRTLKRDHVHLVTDRIEKITERGILTADGCERTVDVIVFATGFQASRFLMPMRITGRDGVDLHESWEGNARAYLGMTVPGFPNLFCLYGPNTNLVANGSIIYFAECQVGYVMGCIRLLLERHGRALECRRGVYDAYNAAVDAGNARMAWGAATVNSWYKNAEGRVTQNWPFTLQEYWQRTRQPDPGDYELR